MLKIKEIENNCIFCDNEFAQYFNTECSKCQLIKKNHFFGFELIRKDTFILDITFKRVKEFYIDYSNPSIKLYYIDNVYNFIYSDLKDPKDLANQINKILIFT